MNRISSTLLAVVLGMMLLVISGCDRSSQASTKQITTTVNHLIDDEDLQILDIRLDLPANARIVITDKADQSTRDALSAQMPTQEAAHITVVASLIKTPASKDNLLKRTASISSEGARVSGPSLIPVPKNLTLSELFHFDFMQQDISRNTPMDLMRIQDRVFQFTLQ